MGERISDGERLRDGGTRGKIRWEWGRGGREEERGMTGGGDNKGMIWMSTW